MTDEEKQAAYEESRHEHLLRLGIHNTMRGMHLIMIHSETRFWPREEADLLMGARDKVTDALVIILKVEQTLHHLVVTEEEKKDEEASVEPAKQPDSSGQ
jgi:hypothetical protein